jgi:hypothetical protein
MALLQSTLGDIGRVGLLKVFRVEASKIPDKTDIILGNRFKTNQSFERFKSLVGLGPPVQVDEGEIIPVDDMAPLFVRNFTPVKFGKAVQFSHETKFVDRYSQVASLQKQMAQAFILKKNLVAAGIDINGFTDTTSGMNAETLYSTSHANGVATGSNRPAIDIALGPLAVAQCRSEIAQQKSARGQIMPNDGEIVIKVPFALEGTAYALAESDQMPGTNNNDANFAKAKTRYEVIPYYTSNTAWFARLADNEMHKLFLLEQIPYDVIELPINDAMMYKYISFETYVAGWADWHGTWGTVGA